MSSSVKVASFLNQTEALIAAEYLRANGIVATVMGDDAGGAFSGLTLSKGFRIFVPRADEELARDLLANPPSSSADTDEGDPSDSSEPAETEVNPDEY